MRTERLDLGADDRVVLRTVLEGLGTVEREKEKELLRETIEAALALNATYRTAIDLKGLVLADGGRLVATGTHAELLRSSELYARLASLQFSDGEEGLTGPVALSGPAAPG